MHYTFVSLTTALLIATPTALASNNYIEIRDLAKEVLEEVGYYFQVPAGQREKIAKAAAKNGVYDEPLISFSFLESYYEMRRINNMKTTFKKLDLSTSGSRMKYVQDLMSKKPVTPAYKNKLFMKIFNGPAQGNVRNFVDIVFKTLHEKQDNALAALSKEKATLEKMIDSVVQRCKKETLESYKQIAKMKEDMIVKAEEYLAKSQNALPLVVESLVIGTVEIFRYAPCALESLASTETYKNDMLSLFGVVKPEPTIFDPKLTLNGHYTNIVLGNIPNNVEVVLRDVKSYLDARMWLAMAVLENAWPKCWKSRTFTTTVSWRI